MILASLTTPRSTLVVVYVSVGETAFNICQPNTRDRFRYRAVATGTAGPVLTGPLLMVQPSNQLSVECDNKLAKITIKR